MKNVAEWYVFAASEKRPKDIPVSPWAAYKQYFKETGGKFSINDFIGAYATRGRPRKDENRQPKDTVNDRRHGGEVGDVHLDQIGPTVFRREFLKVDRGRDTNRQRQHQDHEHHVK